MNHIKHHEKTIFSEAKQLARRCFRACGLQNSIHLWNPRREFLLKPNPWFFEIAYPLVNIQKAIEHGHL